MSRRANVRTDVAKATLGNRCLTRSIREQVSQKTNGLVWGQSFRFGREMLLLKVRPGANKCGAQQARSGKTSQAHLKKHAPLVELERATRMTQLFEDCAMSRIDERLYEIVKLRTFVAFPILPNVRHIACFAESCNFHFTFCTELL